MPTKKRLLAAMFLALPLLASAVYFYTTNKIVAIPEIVSESQLNGMETRVVEKIKRLQREIQENEDSSSAWGKLAMTLDVHGLNEESIRCYQKAAKLDPQDFRWPYYCAIAFKESGSSEALGWFKKGVQLKSDYAPQQIRYAKALFDAGNIKDAEFHFRQAANLTSDSAEAYVGLAQIAMMQNQTPVAIDYAEKAVSMNPRQGEAYSILAILYRRKGDAQKAEQALAKSSQFPQKTTMPDPVYSALVSEGESAFWYRTRGRTYMDAGLYLLALREFQAALEINDDADAHDHVGVALQRLGKWDEAIVHHKKAIALNPGYMKYYNLGIACGRTGHFGAAIEAFKNSIQANPDYVEAYYNLGVAHFKLSEWPEAIKILKIAIEKDPAHAKARYTLAMVYLTYGKPQLAMQQYDVLRNLDPSLATKLKAVPIPDR